MSTRVPKEVLERVRKVGLLPRRQTLRAVQDIQLSISKLRGKSRASALNALGRLLREDKNENLTTMFVAALILLRNSHRVSLKTLNQSLITLGWVLRQSKDKPEATSDLSATDNDDDDDDGWKLAASGNKATPADGPIQWSHFIPRDSLLTRNITAAFPPARACNIVYALIGVVYSNFDANETLNALALLNAMKAKLRRDFGWLVRRISAGGLPRKPTKSPRMPTEEVKSSAFELHCLRQILQREAGGHRGRLRLLFNELRGTPHSWLAFWAAANGPCSNTKLLIDELYGTGPVEDRLLAIQSIRRLWRLRLKGASTKQKAAYLVPALRALNGISTPPRLQAKAQRALGALPSLEQLSEKVLQRSHRRGTPTAAELAGMFALKSVKDDGNRPLP